MSPAEIYIHHFQNSEPSYYTRVPNIIDHLTYQVEENGVKKVRRLSIYAKELYRIMRMIASDNGKDWHTTESLAEIMGCSVGSVYNAKIELLQKFDQLDGNPLIIENKKQIVRTINGKNIKTVLCTRTIVCIWSWNNAFMATIKYQNKFGKIPDSSHESGIQAPDSCGESGRPPDSCGESGAQGPDSCGECNNNNNNKNPLFIEQQPTAEAASVCFSNKTNSVSVSELKENLDHKAQALNWLLNFGFDLKTAIHLSETTHIDDLKNASIYFGKQLKKKKQTNEKIPNPLGYLRKVIKEKYWQKNEQQI